MKIYINSILYPIKTLGPRERIGIWFQGCSIGCKGCMSKHTWETDDKYLTTTNEILKEIKKAELKRITISGGEPFQQPKALKDILEKIKKLGITDIIVYSGMPKTKILKEYPWIQNLCGLLISEPFMESQKTELAWKGSDNQIATVFNNKNLYQKFLKEKKNKKLQIIENTIIGIY